MGDTESSLPPIGGTVSIRMSTQDYDSLTCYVQDLDMLTRESSINFNEEIMRGRMRTLQRYAVAVREILKI